jgi:hypothetical protein
VNRSASGTGAGRLRSVVAAGLLTAAAVAGACGKKGPPLPPLVRLPAPPGELTAARRGVSVDITFVVPEANADGTRPANIQRVEVYGITARGDVADAEILRRGARIASIDVKSPRDPNATIEPDEPLSDLEPLQGAGLDQGATGHVSEQLTGAVMRPADASTAKEEATTADEPAIDSLRRMYVAVGISTRGRRGQLSRRSAVPLLPAPPAPGRPSMGYDETAIRVEWPAPDAQGEPDSSMAFHVYELVQPAPDALGPDGPKTGRTVVEARLTPVPVREPAFDDRRIAWGAERCYAVRAVREVDGLLVESEASPPACVTLADTFPPPVPTAVTALASEEAISLIWNAVEAADLAGYVVLRAAVPGELAPVTPSPIRETTFRDVVTPGVRYAYAVQAVDTAGNTSAPSSLAEETAR